MQYLLQNNIALENLMNIVLAFVVNIKIIDFSLFSGTAVR